MFGTKFDDLGNSELFWGAELPRHGPPSRLLWAPLLAAVGPEPGSVRCNFVPCLLENLALPLLCLSLRPMSWILPFPGCPALRGPRACTRSLPRSPSHANKLKEEVTESQCLQARKNIRNFLVWPSRSNEEILVQTCTSRLQSVQVTSERKAEVKWKPRVSWKELHWGHLMKISPPVVLVGWLYL